MIPRVLKPHYFGSTAANPSPGNEDTPEVEIKIFTVTNLDVRRILISDGHRPVRLEFDGDSVGTEEDFVRWRQQEKARAARPENASYGSYAQYNVFPILQSGQVIKITARKVDADAKPFGAALIGDTCEPNSDLHPCEIDLASVELAQFGETIRIERIAAGHTRLERLWVKGGPRAARGWILEQIFINGNKMLAVEVPLFFFVDPSGAENLAKGFGVALAGSLVVVVLRRATQEPMHFQGKLIGMELK